MTTYNGGTYIKNDLGIHVEQHKEKYKVNMSYECNLMYVFNLNYSYIKYSMICNMVHPFKIKHFIFGVHYPSRNFLYTSFELSITLNITFIELNREVLLGYDDRKVLQSTAN